MFATLLGPYPAADDPDGLEAVIRDQLEAGLGMVTDGRVRALGSGTGSAVDALVDAWRDADAVVRRLGAQLEPGLELPLVKACLVGPYSSAALADGAGDRNATLAAARATNDVLLALFEAGAAVVQLSEDGLAELPGPDDGETARAAEALRRALESVPGHVSLSIAGGNADRAGAALFFDLPFASYTFDLIHGPDNWRLIGEAPADRGIICGVADARRDGPDEEAVMIWAARYAASTNGRGLARVALAPSAGLERLSPEQARMKISGLAEAARKAGLASDDLALEVDPRAVDARSAALGRFDPGLRRGKRRPAPERQAREPGVPKQRSGTDTER